jgi:hypothetical protein
MNKETKIDIIARVTKARDLVAKPGGWTQGVFARDATGDYVHPDAKEACSFCMKGAISHAKAKRIDAISAREYERAIYEAFMSIAKADSIVDFNDDPNRTQQEIVETFDKIISFIENNYHSI